MKDQSNDIDPVELQEWQDAIEDVIRQPEPTARDLAEAVNWRRRLARWMFSAADLMPFLIPHVADERIQLHLRDLRRYLRNRNDIADLIGPEFCAVYAALKRHEAESFMAVISPWEREHLLLSV